MKFWDSSAIVTLLVNEPAGNWAETILRQDNDLIVWWGTPIECVSAIARAERDDGMSPSIAAVPLLRLQQLSAIWKEIQPVAAVREMAMRLLRVHNLRAADSMQLAAALIASEHRPASLDFVCLDARLTLAAQREGFKVISHD